MASEAQKQAIAKYHQKCVTKTIQFSPAEHEMVEHIKQQGRFATYVKTLIRKDMELRQ